VLYGIEKYRAEWLKEISRMVEEFSGVSTAPTKPVVGNHVFTHESGIHVAAVVENPSTYEPFSPEMVGMERRFIIGKHTGKKALRALLAKEGIYIEENELSKLLKNIKVRSGRFKESFTVRELVTMLKSEKLEKKA
jgi:methanogen homocitrate synthase